MRNETVCGMRNRGNMVGPPWIRAPEDSRSPSSMRSIRREIGRPPTRESRIMAPTDSCGPDSEVFAKQFSPPPPLEDRIERKPVLLPRQDQHEEKQCQARDDVRVELVERFFEEMPERHDEQDEPERDQSGAHP